MISRYNTNKYTCMDILFPGNSISVVWRSNDIPFQGNLWGSPSGESKWFCSTYFVNELDFTHITAFFLNRVAYTNITGLELLKTTAKQLLIKFKWNRENNHLIQSNSSSGRSSGGAGGIVKEEEEYEGAREEEEEHTCSISSSSISSSSSSSSSR